MTVPDPGLPGARSENFLLGLDKDAGYIPHCIHIHKSSPNYFNRKGIQNAINRTDRILPDTHDIFPVSSFDTNMISMRSVPGQPLIRGNVDSTSSIKVD